MSSEVCFLLTVLCGEALVRVALKLDRSQVADDVFNYHMEPESREALRKLLPSRLQDIGPIIEVTEIHDVIDVAREGK